MEEREKLNQRELFESMLFSSKLKDVEGKETTELKSEAPSEDKTSNIKNDEGDLEKYNFTKNRRNKTMRYGLKEVADVIFFDTSSDRPVLIFDTLKVSNLENEAESAEATGGQGNAPLVAWDYGRTATLTMQDALLSDQSLAMLSGSEVKNAKEQGVKVTRHDIIDVGSDGAVELSHVPEGEVKAYDNTGGALGESVELGEGAEGKYTITPTPETGQTIAVFYETEADKDSTVVTFSSDQFPATYKVVGTSLVRDEEGVDHPFQFVIPRAKLQSGFTFTMDPENVSAFDFNLQVLVEQGTRRLYDIIRL